MLHSLLNALEELTLLVLPHGGQRTARHNAWRAATDLHVTTGYRWVDQISVSAFGVGLAPRPAPGAAPANPAPANPVTAKPVAAGAVTTRTAAPAADLPAPREAAPRPGAGRAPGARPGAPRAARARIAPTRTRPAAARS